MYIAKAVYLERVIKQFVVYYINTEHEGGGNYYLFNISLCTNGVRNLQHKLYFQATFSAIFMKILKRNPTKIMVQIKNPT